MSDTISEFLDTDESTEVVEVTDVVPLAPMIQHETIEENAKADYHQARESIKAMITQGTDMLEDLSGVAKDSEQPRAYEVMATFMKTISDMNKQLMELHSDAKIATRKPNELPSGEEGTRGIVFVGSTEQLQEQLKIHDEEKSE